MKLYIIFVLLISCVTSHADKDSRWDSYGDGERKPVVVKCGSCHSVNSCKKDPAAANLAQNYAALTKEFSLWKQKVSKLEKTRFRGGGATYTRWGRTTCPRTAQRLYAGVTAGAQYQQKGGGANYLCLHKHPQWNRYTSAGDGGAYVTGTEYETVYNKHYKTTNSHTFRNYNVPCAQCYTPTRAARLMIPGRRTCNKGWTKEYEGYLVAEHYSHVGRHIFVCLDVAPEVIAGTARSTDGALMYTVEALCNRELPCGTGGYKQYREITCVVCTK